MKTLLLYGELLTGKTTQIANLARDVYERTGKKTRVISGDGGGFEPMSDMIDLGIIDPLSVAGRSDLLATMQILSRGDWLVDGKFIKPGDKSGLNNLDEIGLYVVEGTRFLCSTMQGNLLGAGQNFTKADLITDFQITQQETGEKVNVGLPIQTHYGFAQNYIQQIIFSFISLLRRVDGMLVFTTHNYESEADPQKPNSKTVIGPATTGQALVGSLPSMFAQTIHLTKEDVKVITPATEKGKAPTTSYNTEYRAWFRSHKDKKLPAFWEATLRFSQAQIKTLIESDDKRWKRGYDILEQGDEVGIVKLFQWKEEVKAQTQQRIQREMDEARVSREKVTSAGS